MADADAPKPQTTLPMRWLLIAWLAALSTSAAAQQAAVSDPSASSSEAIVVMEEPLQGDHWTYDTRDEITGKTKDTRVLTVTDVTPEAIAVRYSVSGTDRGGTLVFDHAWNVK